jgi:hypothetical protein
MKSIQNQYNQLVEGNLSQANFMRAVRMTFPQYITNVTSFTDSVKILKNKGLLSEAKEEYQCNPVELAMGIKVEMEHTDDPKKAEKIAMDHLKENPSYYSQLKLSGIDSHQERPKAKAKSKSPKAPKKGELVDKENGMKVVKENLDWANKVYGGTGQNMGDTGSSIEFKVIDNTPEYFEIDYVIIPNSRYRQSGAGSRTPREKEYGTARIEKNPIIQGGYIRVKGDSYYVGKEFVKNLQETKLNMFPGEEPNDTVKQAAKFIEMNNTLNPYSNKFILQNIGRHSDRAVLRYGYWEKLPSTLLEKFKLQFNVEEDVEEHDDRLPTTAYILTPLRPIGKVDVGAAFDKFKATLENIVREVLAEENSK